MPADHVLKSFISDVTYKMQADYDRIRRTTKNDPTTAGDEGENGWAKLLADWLPAHYHVRTKGQIVSAAGRYSGQMDVVVLKPAYPRATLEEKKWLADGVVAAFQCKNTVKSEDIEEVFAQSRLVKSLVRPRFGTPYKELCSPVVYGLLSHSHVWKKRNSKPVENIGAAIDSKITLCEHPKLIPDFVCVADLATWRYDYMVKSHSANYEPDHPAFEITRKLVPEGYVTSAGMTCLSTDNTDSFQPIGAFLAALLSRLSREDGGLESISTYFRRAGIAGAGGGGFLGWQPSKIYSQAVADRIRDSPTVPPTIDEWADSWFFS